MAWEYLDGERLESQTVVQTLERLAKYKPEYIFIEIIQKFRDDYNILNYFKETLKNYRLVFEKEFTIEPKLEYYYNRSMICLKLI